MQRGIRVARGNTPSKPTTGLILSGGGARAAYQVGVLKAISDMLPKGSHNPFPVICGTSAGAINAVALATHAGRFRTGVRGLEAVWRGFRAEQVYRTGMGTLSANAARWFAALFFAGLGVRRPAALLDNSPLRQLLGDLIRFERIGQAIDDGDLRALSVTASGYASGQSVAFFQAAPDVIGWRRARRLGVPSEIGLDHLMASSAIPAIFPSVRLNREYFGDGAVRQLSPISPALHLGAERVMVIGVGEQLITGGARRTLGHRRPSLAQIAGHILDSAFLDTLEADIERLQRINRTVSLIPARVREKQNLELRQVDVLTVSPSESLSAIAAEHAHELPRSMRFFLRGSGATDSAGAVVMSYLLFERGFCRKLINLGYADAIKREYEIMRFLGHDPAAVHGVRAFPPQDTW